jgi:hypothetical protein
MKEKRKAMYGTLEFISNVPYYGIFIINPYGVRFCLISPLLLLFMLTVGSCIEQTVLFPPWPAVSGHAIRVLPHSSTGALLRSMPPSFTSLHFRRPGCKHMSESCCLTYAGN